MEEWRDKRSGPAGCHAGNLVLQHVQERYGGPVVRETGTTFGSPKAIYIGRVANDQYMKSPERHICNVSPRQQRKVTARAGRRRVHYLFIAVCRAAKPSVHFWLVPARVIGRIIEGLPVKASDQSCLVRILESRGKQTIGRVDVTRYHEELALSGADARRLVELADGEPDAGAVPDGVEDEHEQTEDDADGQEESIPVEFTVGGQRFVGTVRRTG